MDIIIDENTILPDDMTQKDLDDLLKLMTELAESGRLEEMSIPIDMEDLKEKEPELYKSLTKRNTIVKQ